MKNPGPPLDVEIHQLRALVAVARQGGFTKAAEQLNISQPSLSARIHQLERRSGCQLFTRHSRPVQLTLAGTALLSYAERILGILEAAGEAVQAAQTAVTGQVKVACTFSLATYLLPQVVDRFTHEYSQAELSIEAGHSDYVFRQLSDGLVNLAFAAAFPKYLRQAQVIQHLHDEMGVAAAPTHPLASRQNITWPQIWSYQIILVPWGSAFENYINKMQALSQAVGPVVSVPLAAALPMARRPNTITFMPRRLIAASELIEIDVPDLSFAWDVVLMTRPGRSLSALEQAFANMVLATWKQTEPKRP